jgi:hypothetical protein
MKAKSILGMLLVAAGIVAVGMAVRVRATEPASTWFFVAMAALILLLAFLAGRSYPTVEPPPVEFAPSVFLETALLVMAVFLALAITAFVFSRAHGLTRL